MRIIIGIILAFSTAFACEQPYEEVQGIKIGCPLENIENYHEELLFVSDEEAGQEKFSIKGYIDATDSDQTYNERTKIIVINDNVEHIEMIINNVDPVVADLDKTLGNHILGNYCELALINPESREEYCNQPESNIYVWRPIDHAIVYQARMEYYIKGFRLVVSSQKYQNLMVTAQAEKKIEQDQIRQEILDKKGINFQIK